MGDGRLQYMQPCILMHKAHQNYVHVHACEAFSIMFFCALFAIPRPTPLHLDFPISLCISNLMIYIAVIIIASHSRVWPKMPCDGCERWVDASDDAGSTCRVSGWHTFWHTACLERELARIDAARLEALRLDAEDERRMRVYWRRVWWPRMVCRRA